MHSPLALKAGKQLDRTRCSYEPGYFFCARLCFESVGGVAVVIENLPIMLHEEHIYIPVDQSEEVVAVPLSDLPEDPEEIVDVLKAEVVPFSLWVDFARAYLAQDKIPQYQKLLSFGTLKDVEDFYREKGKFESIQLLCELAATHVDAARSESNISSKTDSFGKATNLLSRARQLDYQEQLPSIGLGELALARVSIELYPPAHASIHSNLNIIKLTEKRMPAE